MSWNGSENKGAASVPKKTVKAPPSKLRGLLALVAVVIAGGIAAWMMVGGRGEEGGKDVKKPSMIAEVKPQIASNVAAKAVAKAPVDKAAEAPADQAAKAPPKDSPGSVRVMTLMDGTVVTNKIKSLFKRPFENVLAASLRPTGTGRTLLLAMYRRYGDDEFMKMLREPVLPEEGDSEAARRCKREVQQLKDDILNEVAGGKTLGDVFDGIASQHASDQMLRVKTRQMQAEAIRSGDPESVREANEVINRLRDEQGIERLEMPARFKPVKADAGWEAVPPEDDGDAAQQ